MVTKLSFGSLEHYPEVPLANPGGSRFKLSDKNEKTLPLIPLVFEDKVSIPFIDSDETSEDREVLTPTYKLILNNKEKPLDWEINGRMGLMHELKVFNAQFARKRFRLDDSDSLKVIEMTTFTGIRITCRDISSVIHNSWKLVKVFKNNLSRLGIPQFSYEDTIHFLAFVVALKKIDEDANWILDFYTLFPSCGFSIVIPQARMLSLERKFIAFVFNGIDQGEASELTQEIAMNELLEAQAEMEQLEDQGARISKIIDSIDHYFEKRCQYMNKFMDKDLFWKNIDNRKLCEERLQYLKKIHLPLLEAKASELSMQYKKQEADLELNYLSFKRNFLLTKFLKRLNLISEKDLSEGQRKDFELDLRYYSIYEEKRDALPDHREKAIAKNPRLYALRANLHYALRMRNIVAEEIKYIGFLLSLPKV